MPDEIDDDLWPEDFDPGPVDVRPLTEAERKFFKDYILTDRTAEFIEASGRMLRELGEKMARERDRRVMEIFTAGPRYFPDSAGQGGAPGSTLLPSP